jgi:hypothetical protein
MTNGKKIDFHLARLIKALPVERQLVLLKQLADDDLTSLLFERIGRLSSQQQAQLAEQLQTGDRPDPGDAESEIALRKHPRQPCLIEARFTAGQTLYRGLVLDISPAGAFIEARGEFSGGQKIELRISLEEHREPLVLAGEILWKGLLGIGVRFIDLNTVQFERIQRFLHRKRQL